MMAMRFAWKPRASQASMRSSKNSRFTSASFCSSSSHSLTSSMGTPRCSHSSCKSIRGKALQDMTFLRSFWRSLLFVPFSSGMPVVLYQSARSMGLMFSTRSCRASCCTMDWRCSPSGRWAAALAQREAAVPEPARSAHLCLSSSRGSASQARTARSSLWSSLLLMPLARGRPLPSYHSMRSSVLRVSMHSPRPSRWSKTCCSSPSASPWASASGAPSAPACSWSLTHSSRSSGTDSTCQYRTFLRSPCSSGRFMALPGGKPRLLYHSLRASVLMTSRHSCSTRRRARTCCCSSSSCCTPASPMGTPQRSHSLSRAERGDHSQASMLLRTRCTEALSAPSREGRPSPPNHASSASVLRISMLSRRSSLWIAVCCASCLSSSSSGALSSPGDTPSLEHSSRRSSRDSLSQAMAFFIRLCKSFLLTSLAKGRPMSSYHWVRSSVDIISMLFHCSRRSVAASSSPSSCSGTPSSVISTALSCASSKLLITTSRASPARTKILRHWHSCCSSCMGRCFQMSTSRRRSTRDWLSMAGLWTTLSL
mmetsp:Transcript_13189/g.41615  ORF Transcript_13189/g.41615 Transcript_13189/m.41615 type:complete len:539 (-) Transcript_13189:284-1900(-)